MARHGTLGGVGSALPETWSDLWFYRIMIFAVKCDRIKPSVGDLADRVRRVVPADDEGHLHPAAFARPQKSAAEDPLRQRVR